MSTLLEPPSVTTAHLEPVEPATERTMTKRVLTAIFGVVLALGALFTTHALPVFILVAVAGIIGFSELVRIAGLEDRPRAGITIGLVCYIVPLVVAWRTPPGTWPFWATVWIAYLAGCYGMYQGLRRGYATPMAAGWLSAPLATVLVTHQQTMIGGGSFAANASLMLLVPLWVGDTMALFVGKAFGRHKLAPSVSPSKTWEGAIGNFVASVATALLIGQYMQIGWIPSLIVGVSSGLLGQLGDLAQSALKRVSGLKDSGAALPGHGGVLDRLDSFLLSSVPGATALWALDPALFHVKLWP